MGCATSQPAVQEQGAQQQRELISVAKSQTQDVRKEGFESNGNGVGHNDVTAPGKGVDSGAPADAAPASDSERNTSDRTPADLTAAVTPTAHGKGTAVSTPFAPLALVGDAVAAATEQEALQQTKGVRLSADVVKAPVSTPDVTLDAVKPVEPESAPIGERDAQTAFTHGMATPPYSPVSLPSSTQDTDDLRKRSSGGIATPLYFPAPTATPGAPPSVDTDIASSLTITPSTNTAESETVSPSPTTVANTIAAKADTNSPKPVTTPPTAAAEEESGIASPPNITTTITTSEPAKPSMQTELPAPADILTHRSSITSSTADLPTKPSMTAVSETDSVLRATTTPTAASHAAQSPVSTTPLSRTAQRPAPVQLFPTNNPHATPPSDPSTPVRSAEPEIISLSVKELFEQLRQQMFSKDSTSAALSPSAAPPPSTSTTPSSVPHSTSMAASAVAPDSTPAGEGLKSVTSQDYVHSAGKEGKESKESVPAGPPPPGAILRVRSKHDKRNTINAAILLKQGSFKLQPLQDFVPYAKLVKLRVEDGIDATRKEDYLSEEDFQRVMGMGRDAFTALPKWRKDSMKKAKFLF